MCTINICFSFSIFSIFYQKIIFHDIQCYVQCDNVYSTFVNGKNLHVNIVTYSDVYNKHLFYMFKHVLTHYLLWYGPPVVVIQRAFLLPQHRCTLPCTSAGHFFLSWERPFKNITMDVKYSLWVIFLFFRQTKNSSLLSTDSKLKRLAASLSAMSQTYVELHFSSVKIKQLHRFGRFYLLRVSTSKRSPKQMQLSLIVGIAFGFGFPDDLDFHISGFPHFWFSIFLGFNISGVRVNVHLILQSWLNRRFIRGCSSEISIF